MRYTMRGKCQRVTAGFADSPPRSTYEKVAVFIPESQAFIAPTVGSYVYTRSTAIAGKPPDACARRCCAVKSCPLVNRLTVIYWPYFATFTYPSPI